MSIHHHPAQKARSSWSVVLLALAIPVLFLVALATMSPDKKSSSDLSPHTFPSMQSIELRIEPAAMAQLNAIREQALQIGVLRETDESWVEAELTEGDQDWPVELRLKGDWTDHIQDDRWSFRVEVKGDKAWRGLTDFSLMLPRRRDHLKEWLYHKALQAEGVLAPRYDFIRLAVNGEDWGPYAVEEHFTPQLLRRQGRPEGPILRIDETGMWEARVAALRDSAFPYMLTPFLEAAPVRPFKPKSILRDSANLAEFHFADQLMAEYRQGSGVPMDMIDLHRTASYYALTDLFGAYHSLIWHNRRYYFNPVSSQLEPVGYDGFSGQGEDTYINGPIWGYRVDGWNPVGDYHEVMGDFPFRDDRFVREYFQKLSVFSDPAYLDHLLESVADELHDRERFIRTGEWGYHFSRRFLEEGGSRIRTCLHDSFQMDHLLTKEAELSGMGQYLFVSNRNPLPAEVMGENEVVHFLPAFSGKDTLWVPMWKVDQKMELKAWIPGLSPRTP
ncbi:MAG: CotH kinase family protein [Bacteroidia bacterium]